MSEREAGGGFFAVDAPMWAKVCALGMNEGVAYVVLARGTARDNRTTAWSVEAIERYTQISWRRAKAAVRRLQDEGSVRLLRGGTKPKYDLVPFAELPGADPRSALNDAEAWAVRCVQENRILNRNSVRHARSAAEKGWLLEEDGEFAIAPRPEIKPALTWLPNELVTGAAGEIPPLELVRQTQDPMILRLFIDLYHAQNLREDGGISRQIVRLNYERSQVGQQAQFVVWGFKHGQLTAWDRWPVTPHKREPTAEEKAAGNGWGVDFWKRCNCLVDLSLLEWVPHLLESGEESGEIIHPLGKGGTESIEDRLGRAANEAGRALVTERQYDWAVGQGIGILVPVPRHIANVQVIGIARLRYRPRTKMTGAWWAELNTEAEKHLSQYAEIARKLMRAAG